MQPRVLGPRSRRRFNLLPRHGGVDASYAEESLLQPNGISGVHTLRLQRTFQPTGSTCAEILITEYGLDLIPRFADVGVVSCSWLFLAVLGRIFDIVSDGCGAKILDAHDEER
jgi:hypothetical protein